MNQPLIKPTIGRVVLFYPAGHDRSAQPHPALISYVHSDTCINLGGFNQNGEPVRATSVLLVPAGEPLPETGNVATWMPYQAAVAAEKAAQSTDKK